MSATLTTFEVRVEVKQGSKHYQSFLGMYVQDKTVKMFHKDARTREQAIQKCEKYGRPLSARKLDVEKIDGSMVNLNLEEIMINPWENALAMDEMIWRKRNVRIQSRQKDKPTLD